jgi:hypothetical protein
MDHEGVSATNEFCEESDDGAPAAVSSSSTSPDAAGMTFADACLKCPTAQCAASKCRRQTDKYRRGLVVTCDSCPKHVRTYLRCVQCKMAIHVGCADSGGHTTYLWTASWRCYVCSNSVPTAAVSTHVPSASDASVTPTSSHLQPTAATSDSLMTYENFEAMHCAVRAQGFRTKTTNYIRKHGVVTELKSSVYWECTTCSVRVMSAAVDGEDPDSAWKVSVKPHKDGCAMANCHQDVPDGNLATSSTILSHLWQLGAVKGLVQFIERLGASGVPPNNFIFICPTAILHFTSTIVVVHP